MLDSACVASTGVDAGLPVLSRDGRAHLVGIGGCGMRALAEVLSGWGWRVTGSDRDGIAIGSMADARFQVHQGHAAEQVPLDSDLLVHSDAVDRGNPELLAAKRAGIPVLSYFEMLGQLMANRHGLAVAGTHGKSTTTAMLAWILNRSGFDPTVVCGASMLGTQSGGRSGQSDQMLVEACEYRRNFLHLRPKNAIVLGVEPDHFDCYASLGALEDAFGRFARSVPRDGLLLTRYDCPVCRRIVEGLSCRTATFGMSKKADWSARRLQSQLGRYRFELAYRGKRLGLVSLRTPGRHNVGNALAAAALAWEEGVDAEAIVGHLSTFAGLRQRMERKGIWRGVVKLDDYAHHPTEVTAALLTVRQMYPNRRIWCVFQPHQASRTAHLLDELAGSLQNADRIVVSRIFRAREPQSSIGGVTAEDLAARTSAKGAKVEQVHETCRIVRHLKTKLMPGDVLITLTAGDLRKIHDEFDNRF